MSAVVGERDGRQGCGRNQERRRRKGELQVEEKREKNLESQQGKLGL